MDTARLMHMLNGSTYLVDCSRTVRQELIASRTSLLWGVLIRSDSDRAKELEMIDCHFVKVGVDVARARASRRALVEILTEYPHDGLKDGPSFKQVASVVGGDANALRLFGLGHYAGLWSVLTPEMFNVEPVLQEESAKLGMVVISGYPANAVSARVG